MLEVEELHLHGTGGREVKEWVTEDVDTWLSQDLLAKVCSEDLDYIPFEAAPQGRFYAGIDLAERVDYTVITVVEKQGEHLNLVHMKRFPLATSLASAIGYLKILGDRWRRIFAVYVTRASTS